MTYHKLHAAAAAAGTMHLSQNMCKSFDVDKRKKHTQQPSPETSFIAVEDRKERNKSTVLPAYGMIMLLSFSYLYAIRILTLATKKKRNNGRISLAAHLRSRADRQSAFSSFKSQRRTNMATCSFPWTHKAELLLCGTQLLTNQSCSFTIPAKRRAKMSRTWHQTTCCKPTVTPQNECLRRLHMMWTQRLVEDVNAGTKVGKSMQGWSVRR